MSFCSKRGQCLPIDQGYCNQAHPCPLHETCIGNRCEPNCLGADTPEKIKICSLGCNANHGFDCYIMGNIYSEGLYGVSTDENIAQKFFKKSCQLQNGLACEKLGKYPPPSYDPGGYALIPGGTFVMGSPKSEQYRFSAEKQHTQNIRSSFWMKSTEVTEREWVELMKPGMLNDEHAFEKEPNYPKPWISWFEALAFCNALSRREGLKECYQLDECSGEFEGSDNNYRCQSVLFQGMQCEGYRLPTEAEWEYAARAGTTTANYYGAPTYYVGLQEYSVCEKYPECRDGRIFRLEEGTIIKPWAGVDAAIELDAIAVYSEFEIAEVATKRPNLWGLYDMLGNVREWTWEGVSRGCSWKDTAPNCRVAQRYESVKTIDEKAERLADTGFRPVRTVLSKKPVSGSIDFPLKQ